jgi:hypothetical protein
MSVKVKMSEMRAALRKLRMEHSGKAVGKMSAEEIAKEIEHHEAACKHRDMKEKRMSALAKARESRAAKKVEAKPAEKEMKATKTTVRKAVSRAKKEDTKMMKEKAKEDEKLGEEVETIKSRMRGKRAMPKNE